MFSNFASEVRKYIIQLGVISIQTIQIKESS